LALTPTLKKVTQPKARASINRKVINAGAPGEMSADGLTRLHKPE